MLLYIYINLSSRILLSKFLSFVSKSCASVLSLCKILPSFLLGLTSIRKKMMTGLQARLLAWTAQQKGLLNMELWEKPHSISVCYVYSRRYLFPCALLLILLWVLMNETNTNINKYLCMPYNHRWLIPRSDSSIPAAVTASFLPLQKHYVQNTVLLERAFLQLRTLASFV